MKREQKKLIDDAMTEGVTDTRVLAAIGGVSLKAAQRHIAHKLGPTKYPAWSVILPVADGRRSAREIADLLGTTQWTVYRWARRAREEGHNVHLRKTSDQTFIITALKGIKTGHIGAVLYGMPRDVVTWVCGQVPEGATLADVVRGYIVDAYLDEKEAISVTPSRAKPD